MAKIRTLLVDDHPMVREGLRACLEGQSQIRIVGEASDGQEALIKARDLSPDVVLMDISMPRMGGIEAARRMRKDAPKCKVLMLPCMKTAPTF